MTRRKTFILLHEAQVTATCQVIFVLRSSLHQNQVSFFISRQAAWLRVYMSTWVHILCATRILIATARAQQLAKASLRRWKHLSISRNQKNKFWEHCFSISMVCSRNIAHTKRCNCLIAGKRAKNLYSKIGEKRNFSLTTFVACGQGVSLIFRTILLTYACKLLINNMKYKL